MNRAWGLFRLGFFISLGVIAAVVGVSIVGAVFVVAIITA